MTEEGEYAIAYRLSGREFQFCIAAASWSDAEAMLAAIKANGTVFGQVVARLPDGGDAQRFREAAQRAAKH